MNTDDDKWYLLQQLKNQAVLGSIFEKFRDIDIEPLLIKGLNCARFYPDKIYRQQTDFDLAVSEKDLSKAQELADELGKEGILVDIHRGFRHFDELSFEEVFDRSKLVEIAGSQIRVPSDEDHLRIICSHWLGDGGEREDRLWDIYYAVENRKPQFDWDICLNSVSDERRKWVIYAITLAQRLKGLDITELPFRDLSYSMPEWILRSVKNAWKYPQPIKDIRSVTNDKREFMVQVKKRLLPNPIAATILMNGDLDSKFILKYQIRWFLERVFSSVKNRSKSIGRKNIK